jgi:hypothetical protein
VLHLHQHSNMSRKTTTESMETKIRRLALMAPHIPPPPSRRYLRHQDPAYQPGQITQRAIEERATEFSHQTFVSAPESHLINLVGRVVNDQTTGMKPVGFVSHNAQTQVSPWPPLSLQETLPDAVSNYDTNGLSGKTQSHSARRQLFPLILRRT